MHLPPNKPLRNLGIYELQGQTLILVKRSDTLAFLFGLKAWDLHGPVAYRVSHGGIYSHGEPTTLTDADLFDTGMTASPPNPYKHPLQYKIIGPLSE